MDVEATQSLLESSVVRSHVAADAAEEKAVKDRATPRSTPRSGGSRSSPRVTGLQRLASPFGTPRLSQSPFGTPRADASARAGSTPRASDAFKVEVPTSPPAQSPGCMRSLARYILSLLNSQPSELAALCALLPIIDPVTDLAIFNQLLSRHYYGCAAAVFLGLLLHWRCCVLYAALTPVATRQGAAALYWPLLLFPFWGRVVGEEVTQEELDATYADHAAEGGDRLSPSKPTGGGMAGIAAAAKPAVRPPTDTRPPPLPLPRLPKLPLPALGMRVPSSPPSPPPSPAPAPAPAPLLSPSGSTVIEAPPQIVVEAPPVLSAVRHTLTTTMELVGYVRKRAPGTASRVARYGTEAARVRDFVVRHRASYARLAGRPLSRLCFLIMFEAKLTGLSIVLGPFVLWRAALTLASGMAYPASADEPGGPYAFARLGTPRLYSPRSVTDAKDVAAMESHYLHCRVLTFVEAACESLPQLLGQTAIFAALDGAVEPNLYLFSAACSLGVVALALVSFAQHRLAVTNLLHPPKSDFVAQVFSLCEATEVADAALLLAAIAAARDAGVTAAELTPAVARLQETRVGHARSLRAQGCPPAVLMDAGYTSAELYAAGHTASQLREAGFSLESLERVGYSLAELMEAGYSAAQLHSAGHSLADLHTAGYVAAEVKALRAYSPAELKGVGYTTEEMKIALYSPSELYEAGFSIADLKRVGFSIEELRAVGCTPTDLRVVGFSAAELKTSSYSSSQLKEAGYALAELQAVGYSTAELAAANYSATELKGRGYTAVDLRDHGFFAGDLKQAGFAVSEVRHAGYAPHEMRDAAYSVHQLSRAGYAASELRDAGYSPSQLKQVGYTAPEMRQAGFTAAEMRAAGINSAVALKTAGFTAAELRDAKYSAAQTKAAGFTLAELKAAGYSVTQLRTAGFVLSDFKAVGCSPAELRESAYSAVQLRAAGYTAAEQVAGGYSAADLKSASYTAQELKAGGLSAAALRGAGFSAPELRLAMYTPVHMAAAGYTARQMTTAGYARNSLLAAGYSDEDLSTAGCQSNAELRAQSGSNAGSFAMTVYGGDAPSA